MRVLLRDVNPAIVKAWQSEFEGTPGIEISQGEIFGVTADAIISPANSFGFMDGGIDYVYSEHFGSSLESRLRALLLAEYDGELPVGQAAIVATGSASIPWLISAPTMRVPMDVSRTANAYLAFRAALIAARRHNASSPQQIQSVLCPGLGTAVGRMAPRTCARQMHAALMGFRAGPAAVPASLTLAVANHMLLTD
jgi:O-acetyl-ADP-ribose deacetylase (regulator of RNase III)